MSFGEQLRKRREELGISRAELAGRLGISRSAVGNYETGVSAPKEEVLLRLFDALGVDPNYLYRDAYRAHGGPPHHPPVCQSRRRRICRPGVQRGL